MKTFRKSYVPESIEHNGKKYVLDGDSSANISLGVQIRPRDNSIKVVVTNPRLRNKTDLHGNPYPSSTFYFIPYETPEEIKARKEQEERDQERIEFWIKMFLPRTKKWCKETLKRLRTEKENPLTDPAETPLKIAALKRVLGK
jgi:hypothetical protein